jgi:hypothetical protein
MYEKRSILAPGVEHESTFRRKPLQARLKRNSVYSSVRVDLLARSQALLDRLPDACDSGLDIRMAAQNPTHHPNRGDEAVEEADFDRIQICILRLRELLWEGEMTKDGFFHGECKALAFSIWSQALRDPKCGVRVD